MRLLLAFFVLYLVLLIATLAYALRNGGSEERQGALTILLGTLLSEVASEVGPSSADPRWGGIEIDLLVIDAAAFIAFLVIAYRSKKFWPIWAAASQLVAVLTHWVVILNPSIVRTVYATAQPFWIFPVLAAVALGTRAHQRSLRETAATG
ncbi:MAG TPA: hypothetical protein VGR19_00105 [Allosphingosinicella sp.]|nr:hypothetical protein [Allosphingosinicella sp.]